MNHHKLRQPPHSPQLPQKMLQIPYRTINQPQLNNMICLEQELENYRRYSWICASWEHFRVQFSTKLLPNLNFVIPSIWYPWLFKLFSLLSSFHTLLAKGFLLHPKCWRRLCSSLQPQHFSLLYTLHPLGCQECYIGCLCHLLDRYYHLQLPLDACIWFWKTIPRWDLLSSEVVTLYSKHFFFLICNLKYSCN